MSKIAQVYYKKGVKFKAIEYMTQARDVYHDLESENKKKKLQKIIESWSNKRNNK